MTIRNRNEQTKKYGIKKSIYNNIIVNVSLVSLYLLYLWPKYAFFPLAGLKINPFTAVTGFLLIAYIIMFTLNSELRDNINHCIVRNKLLFFFFLFWFAARFISGISVNSQESIYTTIHYITNQGFYFFIGLLLASRVGEVSILRIIMLCSSILIAISMYDYILQDYFVSLFRGYLFFGLPDELLNNKFAVKWRGGEIRVQSLTGHPIVLAQLLAGIIPIYGMKFIQSRGVRRWGFLLLAILGGLAVDWTQSRAGLVAMCISCAVSALLYAARLSGRSKPLVMIVGIAGVLLSSLWMQDNISGLVGGRNVEETMSSESRDRMWEKSYPYIEKRPLFGYGDSVSVTIGGFYDDVAGVYTIDDSVLSIMLDFGIFGIISLSGFLVVLIYNLCVNVMKGRLESSVVNIGLLSIVIAIVVVQKVISLADNLVYLYLVAGIVCGARLGQSQDINNTRVVH